MEKPVLFLTSFVLAATRIAGHKSEAFQAVAHVFVGGLFGAYIADRKQSDCLRLAILLSLIEVACAITFKIMAVNQ
jgi:uncharacterized membrane protein YfcA